MIYYFKVIWYYIEIAFANILIFLHINKSTNPIPEDTMYCYVWDEEREKREPHNKNGKWSGYWIKPCKYYRNMKGMNAACTYTGFIGWDPAFGDQCKICGKKYPKCDEKE